MGKLYFWIGLCLIPLCSSASTPSVSIDTLERFHVYFTTYGIAQYYGKTGVKQLESVFRSDVNEVLNVDVVSFNSMLNNLMLKVPSDRINVLNQDNHCLKVDSQYFESSLINDQNKLKILTLLSFGGNHAYRKAGKWPLPENKYDTAAELRLEDCYLGICNLWNIIRFYYPYRELLNLEDNSNFDAFLLNFIKSDELLSIRYYRCLLEVSSLINDCHTQLIDSDKMPIENHVLGTFYPRLGIQLMNGLMIIKDLDYRVPLRDSIFKGDTITKINGIDYRDYMHDYNYLISCEHNENREEWLLHYLLRGHWKELKSIHVNKNGLERRVELVCETPNNYSNSMGSISWVDLNPSIAKINDSTMYVKPDLSRKDFKRLKKGDFSHLILDCTVYPNRFSWKIIHRLNPTKVHMYNYGTIKTPCRTRYHKVRYRYLYFPSLVKNFDTKTYVLQDEGTGSFGESVLLALKFGDIQQISSWGTTSSGTLGDVKYFQLPGGVYFSTTVGRQVAMNGRIYQYSGLKPDFNLDLDKYSTPDAIWEAINTFNVD